MPAAQMEHAVASNAADMPAAQFAQAESRLGYVPAGHSCFKHVAAPEAAAYIPAAHFEHALLKEAANMPATQVPDTAESPFDAQKLPTGQTAQVT